MKIEIEFKKVDEENVKAFFRSLEAKSRGGGDCEIGIRNEDTGKMSYYYLGHDIGCKVVKSTK